MGYRTGGGMQLGFGPPLGSTVKTLLAVNISVHIALLLLPPGAREAFVSLLGLVPADALPSLHLWQFVTYMFLHGGFWHLFFNMFALWMFGSEIEQLWGRRAFLTYYFVTGLGGGLTYCLTSWGSQAPLVGASGAIFGLLLAYGLLFPERQILLYFIIPIRAKWFVLLFGVFELLAAQQRSLDGIGHFAHLGGMLFGYLWLKAGGPRRAWPGWPGAGRGGRARFRVVGGAPPGAGARRRERVDEILEKISREGLQSLTAEEQEILRGAGRKH